MTLLRKRLGAAVAVAAVALLGLPGLAATASAAPAPSNIDPGATGSLTITAQERIEEGGTGGRAIAGAEFTVRQVMKYGDDPVNLTTPEGWEAIEGIKFGDITERSATLADGTAKTTGDDGTVTFDGLALGLYYVTQTGSPTDVAAQSMPFLVTIPYPTESTPPGESTGEWLYDVEVNPKSVVATANKTVDDSTAFALGDTVTWTLTGSIPQLPEDKVLSTYTITDELDARLLYVEDSAEVVTRPEAGLVAGDYTLTAVDQELEFELLESGLEKLADIASPDAALTVTVDTEVVGVADDGNNVVNSVNGVIENSARFTIGEASFVPTAVTEWGAVRIYKHVAGDKDAPLADAVFQVYDNESDAKAKTNPVELLIDGQTVTEFTTGADGYVLIPGLKAGKTVYIVETKAPAGYTASADPLQVDITTDLTEVSFANTQRTGVDLPVLGAQGMALAGVIGLGLMGGGTALALVTKRRKANARA